jgi:hypothetical protein
MAMKTITNRSKRELTLPSGTILPSMGTVREDTKTYERQDAFESWVRAGAVVVTDAKAKKKGEETLAPRAVEDTKVVEGPRFEDMNDEQIGEFIKAQGGRVDKRWDRERLMTEAGQAQVRRASIERA